jgi:hypothetical protein
MQEGGTGSDPNIQSLSYFGCTEVAKAISPFIRRFDVDSAACAIFCINSWHENRSSQNSTYALNAALLSIDEFGTESITDYESFAAFFAHIKEALAQFCYPEDEVVPVMGQTLIPFAGKWRNALYGCGTTLEYPRLCFADAIIDTQEKIAEFEELLDYVDEMAKELGGGGCQDPGAIPGEMQMPTRDYWNRTCRWMKSNPVKSLSANTIETANEAANYLENKCFLMTGARVIPLFCPSILEDYLSQSMAERKSEHNQAAIEIALLKQARTTFDLAEERGSSVLAFPLFAVDAEPVESCPATFFLFDGTSNAALFYNASAGYNDNGLGKLKALFHSDEISLEVFDYIKVQNRRRKLILKQPNRLNFTIIAYHENIEIAPITRAEMPSEIADCDCGAADLMAILMMANSASEICSFFQFATTTSISMHSLYAAASDYFITWSKSNKQLVEGAEDHRHAVTLFVDFNETDKYFVEFFRDEVVNFPTNKNGEWILGSPFAYNLKKNKRNFTEITRKSDGRSFGSAKKLSGGNIQPCFIYLRADFESARTVPQGIFEQHAYVFNLIEDLLMCIANDAEPEIAGLISDQGSIELIYVMPGGFEAKNLPTIDNQLGIRGLLVESDHPVMVYSVDSEMLCNALSGAQDRRVECRFAQAVLSLIGDNSPNAMQTLASKLSSLSHGEKIVDAEALSLPYRWRYSTSKLAADDVAKAAALKLLAYIIDDKHIEPGRYFGADANDVIRKFQKALNEVFESQITCFEEQDLLVKFYEILASSSHSFYVNTRRYHAFSNLHAKEEMRTNKEAFALREDSRREVRASMFSIETLLSASHHGDRIATKEEVAKLIAIAEQLCTASDAADMLRFEPTGMGIEIASNCVATMIEDKELAEKSQRLKSRQLLNSGHEGSDATEDLKFIDLAKEAFETDTGISFSCFLDVLSCLSLDSTLFTEKECISPSVISIEKASMSSSIEREFSGKYDKAMLDECINFLTLDSKKLKEINGKKCEVLPFGRTKDRPNRLELKPLIEIDGRIVFSPIRTGLLQERWIRGIADRFLPAKAAFPSLTAIMETWKHRYEKALEKDVQDCFLREGFSRKHVFRGLELCKKGNHPQWLGDYDGLAYSPITETIWVIECKEFEKIESAFDYMQLQRRWFGENGKLLKYERRIRYLQDNLENVAADLGFEHKGTLHVRPYLVSNKLFINTIGQSNFEVISLSELESLLKIEKSNERTVN